MADFTPHQQKIIKRYYDNQDAIKSQRLAELVTDLYLSTGKKRERAWAQIVSALEKLGVPKARIDHLRKQDNPALVAELVTELQKKE
jgi:acetylornithine deacetylase/succinyl-diaminopimelate desuccinylase-like protein